MADNRKLMAGILNLPESARKDLAQRAQDVEREGVVGMLRKASGEMYNNPIVNTAIGFTPGVGDIQAAGETIAALNRGAPWQETAGYAVGMLPFVPALRTTWHGSPHGFERFDMSKIGTGEGAQAYGHGLYLAESPDVATEYSKMSGMVQPPPRRMFQGAELTPGTPEYHAGTLLERSTLPAARKEVAGWIKEAENWSAARKADPREMEVLSGWSKTLEALNQASKKSDFSVAEGGNLYKVDLPDEQIAKMLDYDLPLAQQPESVKQSLLKLNDPHINEALSTNPVYNEGGDYWSYMGNTYGSKNEALKDVTPAQLISGQRGSFKSPQEASQRLYEAGIPGIQYLDQASRGAGDGTRNYVVFSDEIPQILERNNQPLVNALRNKPVEQLESLNPTGTIVTEYNPASRASLPLGKNLTTLDVTMGANPDEMVTIYRGVPSDVSEISPGDFITTNEQLAKDYAGNGKVISQKVPARTVLDDLTEPLGEEYIYRP